MTPTPGEHIDYALFGVFPAAIERDILIACASRPPNSGPPGSVVVENTDRKYARQEFVPEPRSVPVPVSVISEEEAGRPQERHVEKWYLDIDTEQLRWESYVKAGYYV